MKVQVLRAQQPACVLMPCVSGGCATRVQAVSGSPHRLTRLRIFPCSGRAWCHVLRQEKRRINTPPPVHRTQRIRTQSCTKQVLQRCRGKPPRAQPCGWVTPFKKEHTPLGQAPQSLPAAPGLMTKCSNSNRPTSCSGLRPPHHTGNSCRWSKSKVWVHFGSRSQTPNHNFTTWL